jgi:RecB family exonuclease
VTGMERAFELTVTGMEEPFIGVIDLVAEIDAKKTVVDFKTSGSTYAEHEVALSDQLTAYQLAEPDAEQMALCVLAKTKEPKIEWHLCQRTPEDLLEYLARPAMWRMRSPPDISISGRACGAHGAITCQCV